MSLSDIVCRKATCPEGKARARFTDAGGLYLEVAATGSQRWFWKYRHGGKERRLALGGYPAVTLKAARNARDQAREVHKSGADPVQQRKLERRTAASTAANTFEEVAREFHERRKADWSDKYADRWIASMQRDVFPWLGKLPVSKVTAPMLLEVMRRIEARGANETAHSCAQWCGQIFQYAIVEGKAASNPAPDLRGSLAKLKTKHLGAMTEPDKLGELLRSIAGYPGHLPTRIALQLSMLLFQRPGGYTAQEATAHGARATARTMIDEQLGIDAEVVEEQLAHGKRGPLGGTYNRTKFLKQRVSMMNRWADYLDGLRDGV